MTDGRATPRRLEGPSLRVVWCDNTNPDVPLCSRYYPLPLCSQLMAEDHVLGWFRSRRCTIRSLEWAWGVVPRGLPKSRFIPVPMRTKT